MISLKNCNCLDGLKEIKSESVDLLATDPPYRIVSGGDSHNLWVKKMGGGDKP